MAAARYATTILSHSVCISLTHLCHFRLVLGANQRKHVPRRVTTFLSAHLVAGYGDEQTDVSG